MWKLVIPSSSWVVVGVFTSFSSLASEVFVAASSCFFAVCLNEGVNEDFEVMTAHGTDTDCFSAGVDDFLKAHAYVVSFVVDHNVVVYHWFF